MCVCVCVSTLFQRRESNLRILYDLSGCLRELSRRVDARFLLWVRFATRI